METIVLNATEPIFGSQIGKTKLKVHDVSVCWGRNCCIHNPSQHHMITWEMNWRGDRKIMERLCTHYNEDGTIAYQVGHPDPDDAAFRASIGDNDTVHGCDGCCARRLDA